jgi:hypothetical protein
MVNGWLKLRSSAVAISQCPLTAANERIFATKTALTSTSRRDLGRSEVVLAQAILGLLINRTAAFAAGN